jgi:hypothetical protein
VAGRPTGVGAQGGAVARAGGVLILGGAIAPADVRALCARELVDVGESGSST